MKTQEPKNEWEEEIKEIAPWLPLNGSFFEKKRLLRVILKNLKSI